MNRCEVGQVWTLGRHRVACGDARDAALVGRLFGPECLRMVWTDPPYGISYAEKNEMLNLVGKGHRVQEPIAGDHAPPKQVEELVRSALTLAVQHSLSGATCYVASPGGAMLTAFIRAFDASGFDLKHTLVWVKNHTVLGRADHHYQHENILHGWRDGAHYWCGRRDQSSVFFVNKPHASDLHPTMKPVELVAPMVANSSRLREVVYDPFLGSGTTLVACEHLLRRCFGCELEPHYAEVTVERWERLTGCRAALEVGGGAG